MQLILLALQAQQIGTAPGAIPATVDAADALRERIDDAAEDLRHLVHNVLPAPLVEQGLAAATEDLVDRLAVPATLDVRLPDEPLTATVTRTAYLAVAEALTNATKHSRASQIDVSLWRRDTRLCIEVVDDGVGGAAITAGRGLAGVVDRVDAIGGSVTVHSSPGRGTRLRVELPCG